MHGRASVPLKMTRSPIAFNEQGVDLFASRSNTMQNGPRPPADKQISSSFSNNDDNVNV